MQKINKNLLCSFGGFFSGSIAKIKIKKCLTKKSAKKNIKYYLYLNKCWFLLAFVNLFFFEIFLIVKQESEGFEN